MTTALDRLATQLQALTAKGETIRYRVPGLWAPVGETPGNEAQTVNPYTFFQAHIAAIRTHAARQPLGHYPLPASQPGEAPGDWISRARVYNLFVRLGSAYDHDGDGLLGQGDRPGPERAARTLNDQGIRESGTFLKSLALLGHLHRLGCTAVHLLPVTAVGSFGNKGNLGSPYAIQNPYRLEPTLADPLVDADVETQFAAFVEACHLLGIRVILEFVFRTSARDGDWVAQHPDWFYWIRRDIEDRPGDASPHDPRYYGVPPFGEAELAESRRKVEQGCFDELPAPPAWYQALFHAAPPPSAVAREADGRYSATNPDGHPVHVPGAFADWPPDDFQPPWTDVTYLKMFNDPPEGPSFNYIAYNTIRMYDSRLARPAQAIQPLWEAVGGIVPHYIDRFGIDGVMVDMGHALPHDLMAAIITRAREHHPDFALLSENFAVEADSRATGYNAVLGYQFVAVAEVAEMRRLIERSCVPGLPIPACGTAETHNTPRTAMRQRGAIFCETVWLLNNFLPRTIPFIHGGFELAQARPVNLGLRFLPEEMVEFSTQTLGLFDIDALAWDAAGSLPERLARIAQWRERFAPLVLACGPDTFGWLEGADDDCLCFWRRAPGSGLAPLVFVLAWGPRPDRTVRLALPAHLGGTKLTCLQTGVEFALTEDERSLVDTLGAYEGRLYTFEF